MTFSPLFHAATPLRLVIGPKLGASGEYDGSRSSCGGVIDQVEEQGWTIGANVGVFFPSGTADSLGMLFSFANMQITRACRTVSGLRRTVLR